MTDKDFVKTLVGEVMTTHDAESIIKGIEILEAENASLRERLGNAVELPLKVGSTVYIIHETDEEDKFNPWIDTGRIVTFSFDAKLWIFVRYNSGLTMWYSKDTFDKEVCLTLEAAETRLAELKEKKILTDEVQCEI